MRAQERVRLQRKLDTRKEELAEVSAAISAILKGKAQSYGIGTRNKSAYGMALNDLYKRKDKLESDIDRLEDLLGNSGYRRTVGVVPQDW